MRLLAALAAGALFGLGAPLACAAADVTVRLSPDASVRGEDITLGELAGLESVQPPTMTRIVVALEEQGLVLREADPADRRIARVHVTTAGRKLLERNRSRKTAYLASRMRGLSAEELEVLERAAGLLERMTADER